MQRHQLLSLNLVAAGVLLAWSPTAVELRFAPEVGSSVAKTFTSEMDFEIDDMTVVVDGEDVLGTFGVPEFSLEVASSYRVVDQYLAVSGGRATTLQRLYESLGVTTEVEVSMMGEAQGDTQETGSRLEGKRLEFTWDEDEEDYRVAFAADDSGAADLLEGVEEDMDLRVLLPGRSVGVGDTWELSFDALKTLWMPGGDMAWEVDGDSAELQSTMEEALKSFMKDLGDQVTGTRNATYRGTREVGGRTLGVVEISIDVEVSFDGADLVMDLLASADEMPEGLSIEFDRASFTYASRLSGEMLWDQAAGRADSMALAGDYDVTVEIGASVDMMGEETSFEATILGSGTQSMGLATESR